LKPGIDSRRRTLIGPLLVSLGRSIVDKAYRSIGQVRLCGGSAMNSTNVVVIGGGCIGLASAITLAAGEQEAAGF
jgi:NADPH-dependent 2,4-dienoyl-CoA reductase/sulfur reductase-like enzyme